MRYICRYIGSDSHYGRALTEDVVEESKNSMAERWHRVIGSSQSHIEWQVVAVSDLSVGRDRGGKQSKY